MKISVIVPLYNQGQFVAETFDSLLAQTHKDIEVICVNDASTDNSLEVAQGYADKHSQIRVISNPKNIGLPPTRNVGLRSCTGEFVLPLDSDDWIDPRHLEKTSARMTEGVGVVSTWMQIFGLGRERAGAPNSSYPIFAPTLEQITTGNSLAVCSLIRRETLLEVGGWPEDLNRGSEDWGLWAAIVRAGKWRIEVIPEYLFYYRVHRNSMCRSKTMAPFLETQARIKAKYGS